MENTTTFINFLSADAGCEKPDGLSFLRDSSPITSKTAATSSSTNEIEEEHEKTYFPPIIATKAKEKDDKLSILSTTITVKPEEKSKVSKEKLEQQDLLFYKRLAKILFTVLLIFIFSVCLVDYMDISEESYENLLKNQGKIVLENEKKSNIFSLQKAKQTMAERTFTVSEARDLLLKDFAQRCNFNPEVNITIFENKIEITPHDIIFSQAVEEYYEMIKNSDSIFDLKKCLELDWTNRYLIYNPESKELGVYTVEKIESLNITPLNELGVSPYLAKEKTKEQDEEQAN